MIEIDGKARGLSQAEINEIKQNYKEFASACLKDLKEKGLDGKDIVKTWSEISSFLWSNFTYRSTGFLSEAFDFSSGKFIDCDTSAFFVADIFRQLGISEISVVMLPQHAILNIGGKYGGYYIETTADTTKKDISMSYYHFEYVGNRYGTSGNMVPFSENIAYLLSGRQYDRDEKYDKAIEDFTRAINACPGFKDAYSSRASAYSALGKHELAIADYEKAAAIDPSPMDGFDLSLLATEYIEIKDYKRAAGAYTRSISLYDGASDRFHRAEIFITIGKYDDAISDLSKAIELGGLGNYVYAKRAETYIAAKKYGMALADYSKLIELDPNNAANYLDRSKLHALLKDYDKAIADVSKAMEIDKGDGYPPELLYEMRAKLFFKAKKFEQAALDYGKVNEMLLKGGYKHTAAWDLSTSGDLYMLAGNPSLALKQYIKAISLADKKYLDENNAGLHTKCGNACMALKDHGMAAKHYKMAKDLTYFATQKAEFCLLLGKAYESAGKKKEAQAQFRESEKHWERQLQAMVGNLEWMKEVRKNPGMEDIVPHNAGEDYRTDVSGKRFSENYCGSGYARLQLKDYANAMIDYENAVKADRNNANGYFGLGLAHLALGQPAKAVEAFSAAIAREPKNAGAHFQRAEAYAAMGKFVHATVNYKMAYGLYTDLSLFLDAGAALKKAEECGSKPNRR